MSQGKRNIRRTEKTLYSTDMKERRMKPRKITSTKTISTRNIPVSRSEVTIGNEKKGRREDYAESTGNKSYEDTNDDDPVTVLRKEIQDWKINEILTSRTEERLTGTSSEQQTYSYAGSSETTKRQRSVSNVLKTSTTCTDLPAARYS